jgi:hypothetical protein
MATDRGEDPDTVVESTWLAHRQGKMVACPAERCRTLAERSNLAPRPVELRSRVERR